MVYYWIHNLDSSHGPFWPHLFVPQFLKKANKLFDRNFSDLFQSLLSWSDLKNSSIVILGHFWRTFRICSPASCGCLSQHGTLIVMYRLGRSPKLFVSLMPGLNRIISRYSFFLSKRLEEEGRKDTREINHYAVSLYHVYHIAPRPTQQVFFFQKQWRNERNIFSHSTI